VNGGRPLRFLALLLCGWTGARGVDIYHRDGAEGLPLVAAAGRLIAAIGITPAAADLLPRPLRVAASPTVPLLALARSPELAVVVPMPANPVAAQRNMPEPTREPIPFTVPILPTIVPLRAVSTGASRLQGSAWLIARDGGGPSLPGSQLGASQAGVRMTYALGEARRLSLSARASAPLSGRGKEVAFGIDWQPTRAPIHILAEQRIAVDGGPSGPMLGIVGGFGPAEVAPGIRLEGYGQAGVVAREGGGAFADGAVRAAHPVAAIGRMQLDIGAGIWGGAQRGASRLDVGPSLGLAVPMGTRSLRLAADWRQRVAGRSRPESGPALSIGTNF
jgi:hypothetical protein